MRRAAWWSRLARVAVALLGLYSAPARADARRDYVDALRALREERWAEALPLLERAARDRPQEEARVRLVGAIPEPYLPWHYLGLTYSRLGRCTEALSAWSTSDSQAAIQRLPERMAERQAPRERCLASEAALAAGSEPGAPTAGAVARAADTGLNRLQPHPHRPRRKHPLRHPRQRQPIPRRLSIPPSVGPRTSSLAAIWTPLSTPSQG